MKKIIIKLFLLICALIFISVGVVLSMACLGQFSVDEVTAFYSLLLQTPAQLNILYGFAAAFLCLGLILLLGIFRKAGQIKTIEVRNKGELVRIPVKTIEDFIEQIMGMNGLFNNIYIGIKKKGKWIYIDIKGSYTGQSPIRKEIEEVKGILKGEINRVFEFSFLRIDFQIDGVQANFFKENDLPEKIDQSSSSKEEEEKTNPEADSTKQLYQPQERDEEIIKKGAKTMDLNGKLPWEQ